MLSVENLPDPSCSGKISQLKTDERASDRHALQEADLLKKKQDHLGDTDNNHQLPKFSIRDYVFAARSRDISTNWPFPKPYLQLCSKHGIEDPLPPFETPDSVRNRCSSEAVLGSDQLEKKRVGEVGSLGEKKNAIDLHGESCPPFDPSILGSVNEAPFLEQKQETLTVSKEVDLDEGEEGSIPTEVKVKVKVKSHAQFGSDQSSPNSRFPFPAPEAHTLVEDSVEVEVAGPPCTYSKSGIATEPKGKKCRLIVKLGSISNLSNTEDHTLSTSTISDSMASKVCPVCKTFSSTSNTTLNAHIDQCLAVESTCKLTVKSKLGKHSVKPRKIRSMVDICASAPRCTLQELDRRNGSNWAADLSMPSANVEVCNEGKKQRLSHSHMPLEDNEEDGAVYFDSNGTKLRILSKFKDSPLSTVREDFKGRKHTRDGKDIKNFSTVKRRRLAPRHSKYAKLKPLTESLPQKPDRAEIYGTTGGKYGMEENLKKKQFLSELLKVHDRIKPSESRAVGRWVCSKRTGLSKKFFGQDGSHIPDCSSLALMDPLNDGDKLHLSNSSIERRHIHKLPNSSVDPISSLKSKTVRSLSHGAPAIANRKKSSKLRAGNLSQLSKGSTSSKLDGCMLKLSRSARNHTASPRSMRVEIHAGPVDSSHGLPKVTTSKASRTCHHLSENGKNSTMRKGMLLVGPASPISEVDENGSRFTLKKSRLHRFLAKTVDQVKTFPSNLDEEYDQGYNSAENQSGCVDQMKETHKLDCPNNVFESETGEVTDGVTLGKVNTLEPGEGRLAVIALEREKSIAFGNLQSGPNCCGLNLAATADSQVEHGCCYCRDYAPDIFAGQEPGTEDTYICDKDTVIKLSLEKTLCSSNISSSRNFFLEPHEVGNNSDTWTNNFPSNGKHKRLTCGTETQSGPTELCFIDDTEMDCEDIVGSCNIGKNTRSGSEVGFKGMDENVETSLSEVDVIPIPGPPGSFLPSPGGSEVLQESSSPTSSRVLSSQGTYVLADRDSSGSPVSATSVISHPPHMEGTDLEHSGQESFARPHAILSDFSYHSTKPVVRDTTTFPCMLSVDGAERTNFESENIKFTVIAPSKEQLEYSADQTCCCSRKEGASLGAVLMHEESKFPGQPTMISAKGRQMNSNQSTRHKMVASSSICPSLKIDELMAPILKFPTSPIAVKNSPAASLNFRSLSDSYSATPSSHVHLQTTTHPVLRLMGKNLTVVNKDEDSSIKLGEIMPGTPSGGPNANYLTLLGYSNVSAPSEDCVSIYHAARKSTVIVNQDSCDISCQCYDDGLPSGFRSLGNSEAHRKLLLSQGVNFSNVHIGGSATSSLEHHELPLAQEKCLNYKPNPPFDYVDRVVSSPHPQHRVVIPATEAGVSLNQEVVIIDGSPDNNADSRMSNAKNSEGSKGNQPSPAGILTSTAPNSNLAQVSPFPCFQSRNANMLKELPVRPKPSFLVSCPGGVDAIPVKWKGSFEGSSALLGGPVFAPKARRVV